MTTNASRAAIDFDAFERELQHPAPQRSADQGKVDPLAELARIVGQDDPFRALLEARNGVGQAQQGRDRIEPRFEAEGATYAEPTPEPTPADAFNQYLASVEQEADAADGYALQPASALHASRPGPAEAPRRRGRIVQVGAGLGILVLCVGAALTWRGLGGAGTDGAPITVMADPTPVKAAPAAADGVEIPDQNKQIYEREAKDGQIKIVNREEQPLDVAQAARTASARTDGPAPQGGQGGVTPGGLLTESLGEPRRVRTVSVKPDTPVPAPQREAPEAAVPAPIPTMTMPEPAPQTSRNATRSIPAPEATAAVVPPASPVVETAPRNKATQRVASVSPETTASMVEPLVAASQPAPAAVAATALGGFSVQLGVRTSEREAQAAFREMRAKYTQLAGQPELIRQAEVNGKTIFRVRVGPLGKNEATTLCTKLQGAGGQCFVARN